MAYTMSDAIDRHLISPEYVFALFLCQYSLHKFHSFNQFNYAHNFL
jgi:hypothetical protein